MDVEEGRVPAPTAPDGSNEVNNSRLKLYILAPLVIVVVFLISLLLVYFAVDCDRLSAHNHLHQENQRLANALKSVYNQFSDGMSFSTTRGSVLPPQPSVYFDNNCYYVVRTVCNSS